MSVAELATFAVALFIAAASPGPGMTALVARALGAGFWGTMPMLIGLMLGDLVFLTAAAFGLAALAKTFGMIFMVVKYVGALYLAFLAFKLWTSRPEALTVDATAATRTPGWRLRSIGLGLAITLGNPKTILFYLALLPSLIDLGALTAAGYAEMTVVVILVLGIVGAAYVGAAGRARDLFRNARARRVLDRVAGSMMAGAAIAVAAR
jgi:threonine/homoserine/homoserine lactone efflux protein